MPNVSISPVRIKTPSIVKNVEFAGFIRTDLSTVMCVMSVWTRDLREDTNAALTLGMMSAVCVLKTLFPVARFYPAHTRFIGSVRLPCCKITSQVVLCVALHYTHLLLVDEEGWENTPMDDLTGVPSRKSEKSFKPECLQV